MHTQFAILLVAVLCLTTGGPAYAEWVSLGDDDNRTMTVYADPDTIRRKGKMVKMWVLADFKTAQTSAAGKAYLSEMSQEEFDCAEERVRTLAFTLYSENMRKGNPVYSYSDEDKWRAVFPGSVGQTLWNFACGKK